MDEKNLNLFYWFLAILSCLNFLLYIYSASWYRYKPDDSDSTNKPKAKDSDEGLFLAKEKSTSESIGAKTDKAEESAQENATKRNEEESTQEMVTRNSADDARAKAPTSEQTNETE